MTADLWRFDDPGRIHETKSKNDALVAGLATHHWELVVRSGVLAQHLNSLHLEVRVMALAQNPLHLELNVMALAQVKLAQGDSALDLPC